MSASESPFDSNPYEAPRQSARPEVRQSDYNAVAGPRVVRLLVETRPWVRFLSILGFIGAGLMLLAGLAGAMFGLLMLVLYGLIGLLYLVPLLYLFRYASRISELEEVPHVERLEAALDAQEVVLALRRHPDGNRVVCLYAVARRGADIRCDQSSHIACLFHRRQAVVES